MELIDKAAVIAEIERLQSCTMDKNMNFYSEAAEGEYHALSNFESFLNTLEVKEVDLEKELESFIEHRKAWVKDNWEVEYNNGDSFNHIYDLEDIAKHFYELGLKANNPITATDRGTAEEIIVCLKHIEQKHCINLTKEIQWLRDIVKKGE